MTNFAADTESMRGSNLMTLLSSPKNGSVEVGPWLHRRVDQCRRQLDQCTALDQRNTDVEALDSPLFKKGSRIQLCSEHPLGGRSV